MTDYLWTSRRLDRFAGAPNSNRSSMTLEFVDLLECVIDR